MSASASPSPPSRRGRSSTRCASGQRPQRGYIGVSLQPLDEDIAESLGIPKNQGELIRCVTAGRRRRARRNPAGRRRRHASTASRSPPDESLAYLVSQPAGRLARADRADPRRPAPTVTVAVGERPTEEELARLNGIEDETPVTRAGGSAAVDQPDVGAREPRSHRPDADSGNRPLAPAQRRQRSRAWSSPRSIRRATPPPRASSPATSSCRSTSAPTRTPEEAAAAVAAARAAGRNSVLLLVRRGNTAAGLFRNRAGGALT